MWNDTHRHTCALICYYRHVANSYDLVSRATLPKVLFSTQIRQKVQVEMQQIVLL